MQMMRIHPKLLVLFYCCLSFLRLAFAQRSSHVASRHRVVLQQNPEEAGSSWLTVIAESLWFGGPLNSDPEESYADTGAEVFKITFSDEEIALALTESARALDSLNVTKVTEKNGLDGNPRNRYIWSMALDDNDDLYVGTLNQNYRQENFTSLVWSVVTAPTLKKVDALVDTLLRQWSGSPLFETDGGQIYFKSKESSSFDLKLQASTDHLGFRKMINYNGNIYAGSANGPDGPYNGQPYDFSFYEQGTGAKIFTNAGNSGFSILDDEGNLDSYDKSIRSMVVSSYSNRMFVGTETYECAKVLIYDERLVSKWKKIELENVDCTHSVSQLYDMGDGKILFGAWRTLGYDVYLLDETNNDELTRLNTPTYWQHLSCGVMELRLYKGQLYVGILSFVRGFALVRTSNINDLANLRRSDWELITGNGFQREQREQLGESLAGNDYTWSTAEVNGIYFIGTFAGSKLESRATGQLWASIDGAEWRIIESDAFAASRYMYGFRTMEVTSDQKTLYIGSAVNMYIPDQ